jgi:hypothetical protein
VASILLQVAVSAALSYVARLLAPAQEGPRLQDLKLHTSSYGVMNPLLWGTMRAPGNVIDETDLVEHQHTSGGKGGPEVHTYTYTVSVAIRLCDREIAGITRIWANGRLVFGPGASKVAPVDSANLNVKFYLGTETQLPDPTFEAIHGVGNVPGYRGVAYAVFSDWDLTDYGNTLPNLNFEITNSVTPIPDRVSSFNPAPDGVGGVIGASYDANTGIISVGTYVNGGGGGHPALSYSQHSFTTDGTEVGTPIVDATLSGAVSNANVCYITNANIACFPTSDPGVAWYVNGVRSVDILAGFAWPYGRGVVQGPYLYCTFGPPVSGINRYSVLAGVPAAFPDLSVGGGGSCFGTSDNGRIYVFDDSALTITEYDVDLNVLHVWSSSDFPAGFSPTAIYSNNGFVRYQNLFVFSYAGLGLDTLNVLSINADNTLSLYPQDRSGTSPNYQYVRGPVISLSDGNVLGVDGVTNLTASPQAVLLSTIVADLCERAGLASSEYDVSELTDLVDGYVITQQGPARSMLQPLIDAYFFDAVESDDVVKFVKRGGKSVVTIPDDDLAAHQDSEVVPPLMAVTRTQEVDLPAVVNIDYVNPDADYQTGTQISRRTFFPVQVTRSQSEVSITLPISLTDAHAKAIADMHLYEPWEERQRYSIQTSRKYAKYEPTDIVTARGQQIVIRQKQEVRAGIIKFDGVSLLGGVYTTGGGAVATKGFKQTAGGQAGSLTSALLLDLPLVSDADDPNGFYVAMNGVAPWPGAALMKSADAGATYASVFSEPTPQVTGTTSDVLGIHLGGNTFDESNTVTVVVNGELSSTTELAVLNGANEWLIGAEILQSKNAVLVTANTYVLSGHLRGRRGTEWAMSHGSGERFVLLPAPRVPSPSSELNQSRLYKPVTFGATVATATAQAFANSGASLKPYAPVLLGGGTDASGNVTTSWIRRSRIGGAWVGGVDVPVSEASELYVWQAWDSTYTKCARVVSGLTSQTYTYSSADQVTDFGANQETIYFTVGQIGAIGIGTQARGTAIGAGSSNADPLNPVSPFQSQTSGSSSPPPVPNALNLLLPWDNVTAHSSSAGAFDCSHIIVAKFTTGSITVNGSIGAMEAAEYASAAVQRTACLSTSAGDFSGSVFGPSSRVTGNTVTVAFSVGTNPDGYPALSPSTTYYFNIKNDNGFGVCTCFTGDCSMIVELQKPPGT